MVGLGVGRNMVVSLRFWAECLGVIEERAGRTTVTSFGRALLDPSEGWDPYLEKRETLWTLHWRLAHPVGGRLFAWSVLFGTWSEREWTRSQVLEEFGRLCVAEANRSISPVTLAQHFDVFLRTYLPPNARRRPKAEDELDCPLSEIRLVESVGERREGRSGRIEPVYTFRYGTKPDLSDSVFLAALAEYWYSYTPDEATLTYRSIASTPLGVGRVFCLPDEDLRDRLERIESISEGMFSFRPSGLIDAVHRRAGRIDVSALWSNALSDVAGVAS